MSLLGVIYFFEKGNVSHAADPICLTFYSLRSQKRVEKFHAGKSPEINGEMLQKEEECVNKRRNISFFSCHVSFLSCSWDRLSNEEEIVLSWQEPELFSVYLVSRCCLPLFSFVLRAIDERFGLLIYHRPASLRMSLDKSQWRDKSCKKLWF